MEKILRKLIEYGLRGVDTYTHNGSTWLIFTDNKQWVIELTDNKTLWYNYNFFKQLFCVATDDVVENQKHITKWVENNLINKKPTCVTHFRDARDRKQQFEDTLDNGVKETSHNATMFQSMKVEDTIQNGVKETKGTLRRTLLGVDDITQNGVKNTDYWGDKRTLSVEDTIQNGVRDTQYSGYENQKWVDGVIKGGVKETNHVDVIKFFDNKMEDALQNGVKETIECDWADPNQINEVIREGVKETSHRQYLKTYDVKDTIQDVTEHDRWILDGCNDPVDEVLDNGVKKTLSAVDNAFTFREVEDTIQNGVNETKSARGKYFEEVHDVLDNGVKITASLQSREYTGDIDEVLDNGVRTSNPRQYVGGDIIDKIIDKGVIETHDDVYHHKGRIDGVIKNGVKETINWSDSIDGDLNQNGCIDNVINDGVKETKTPGWDGDIISTVEWLNENNSTSYSKMINDVIENGVKETVAAGYTDPKTNILHIKWGDQIDDVIDNGVKETNVGKRDWTITTNDVIQEGVKETKSIGKESPNYPRPVINHIIKNGEKINGTYAGGQRQSEKCKSVVEYGTKNPTD